MKSSILSSVFVIMGFLFTSHAIAALRCEIMTQGLCKSSCMGELNKINSQIQNTNADEKVCALSYFKNEDTLMAILDGGVDINVQKKYMNTNSPAGRTALHRITYLGDVMRFDLLVAKGINVDIADYRGTTPLMIAAGGGHVELVQRLLAHGADAARKDSWGNTALDQVNNYLYVPNRAQIVQLLSPK